ncbi:MAG: hypothetical protein M1817_006431 [Caeruleum heppii]|nr:MAG: hypothetical protein M1817_006431 [Caeruleum heppii]
MLGWLTGSPPVSQNTDASTNRVKNGVGRSESPESPQTPAPVFAIRAFKTAIFGTPKEPSTPLVKASRTTQDDTTEPIKPPGILLTPGTGATRKKTVSFRQSLQDSKAANASSAELSRTPSNIPGKYPSPWVPKATQRTNSANLTKALYEARSDTSSAVGKVVEEPKLQSQLPKEDRNAQPQEKRLSNDAATTRHKVNSDDDEIPTEDYTLDLNIPRSQSGKYWKSEFDLYHEKTRQEMRKLVKYKHMATTFAKKKDLEAVDLEDKLREQRQKMADMEEEVVKLAKQIESDRTSGSSSGADEGRMMSELARQTALSVQYKEKLEQFQDAMDHRAAVGLGVQSLHGRTTSTQPGQQLDQTKQEVSRSRERLAEMERLRSMNQNLREELDTARSTSQRLEDSKMAFEKEVARCKAEVERTKHRHQAQEERQKRREERLEARNQELVDRLSQARTDRQQEVNSLRARHEAECKSLRREIETIRFGQIQEQKTREAYSQVQQPTMEALQHPPPRHQQGAPPRHEKAPRPPTEQQPKPTKRQPLQDLAQPPTRNPLREEVKRPTESSKPKESNRQAKDLNSEHRTTPAIPEAVKQRLQHASEGQDTAAARAVIHSPYNQNGRSRTPGSDDTVLLNLDLGQVAAQGPSQKPNERQKRSNTVKDYVDHSFSLQLDLSRPIGLPSTSRDDEQGLIITPGAEHSVRLNVTSDFSTSPRKPGQRQTPRSTRRSPRAVDESGMRSLVGGKTRADIPARRLAAAKARLEQRREERRRQIERG